jgi:hypothetical protein
MKYQYLGRRAGSNYEQLFFNGRGLRAETLYRQTVGNDPRTPQQVAEDFNVPLEAVLEAIHYCTNNDDLLRKERERDIESLRCRGLLGTPTAIATDEPAA